MHANLRAPHFGIVRNLGAIAIVATAALIGSTSGLRGDEPTANTPIELRDNERIVWLGGTFVERMQQDNYLETMLTSAFPAKKLTFRNLGWSGDTVGGESRGVFGGPNEGFARLLKDTKEAQPTLIALQYGANEAMRGPDGVAPFVAGLQRLIDALADTKARFVLVSPCPREKLAAPLPDPSTYNEHLKLYDAAMRQVATQRGAGFISLGNLLAECHARLGTDDQLTDNGLHFNPLGAFISAQVIALKFGAQVDSWEIAIDAQSLKAQASGATISDLNRSGKKITLNVKELIGPQPTRPLPIAPVGRSAGISILKVSGLVPGKYVLKGNESNASASANGLRIGIRLNLFGNDSSAAKLRETIRAKNELYFHRYRPQNETYLFLFRKHEQGNNAVEIPQFDPLVAEKEQLIHELSQPLKYMLELSPVE